MSASAVPPISPNQSLNQVKPLQQNTVSDEDAANYADSIEKPPSSNAHQSTDDSSNDKSQANMSDVYKGINNLIMNGVNLQESNYRENIKRRSYEDNS